MCLCEKENFGSNQNNKNLGFGFCSFLKKKQGKKMGAYFTLVKNAEQIAQEEQRQLLKIVANIDSNIHVDLTNIVLEYLGSRGTDFVLEDEFRRLKPDFNFQEVVCRGFFICHRDRLRFFGTVDHGDYFQDFMIKWTKFDSKIDMWFREKFPTNGSHVKRSQTLRRRGLRDFEFSNTLSTKETHLTVTTAKVNKHYIIHDTSDLGYKIRNVLPQRFRAR